MKATLSHINVKMAFRFLSGILFIPILHLFSATLLKDERMSRWRFRDNELYEGLHLVPRPLLNHSWRGIWRFSPQYLRIYVAGL